MIGWILTAFMGLSSPAAALVALLAIGGPALWVTGKVAHGVGYYAGKSEGRAIERKRCEESAEKARKSAEAANELRAAELKKLGEAEAKRNAEEADKWKKATADLEATLATERKERKDVALKCWSVKVVKGIQR